MELLRIQAEDGPCPECYRTVAQLSGVSTDTAFDRLRSYARADNLRLADRCVTCTLGSLPQPPAAVPSSIEEGSCPVPEMNTRPPLVAPATARSGAASMCSCELDTEPGPAGPILVLCVAGAIDVLTLPLLRRALTAAVDQQPADLVIDLAAAGFCCARGFGLLATTAATTATHGTGYALSGLSPHLDRVAALLWAERPWVQYRSAAAAVTAIRIEQSHRPT